MKKTKKKTVNNKLKGHWGEIIGTTLIGGFFGWLAIYCAVHDIDISTGSTSRTFEYDHTPNPEPKVEFSTGRYSAFDSFFFTPKNSEEEKILVMAEEATKFKWDSDKRFVADDIYYMVKGSEDDNVKKTAIQALTGIARSMKYDSDRRYVINLVKEV